jgi:hypothetical protein
MNDLCRFFNKGKGSEKEIHEKFSFTFGEGNDDLNYQSFKEKILSYV